MNEKIMNDAEPVTIELSYLELEAFTKWIGERPLSEFNNSFQAMTVSKVYRQLVKK